MAAHFYKVDEQESPSAAVERAVADVEGCDPDELQSLNGAIDTQTLNSLFDTVDDVRLSFEYLDYRINVNADGEITITEL